MYVPLVLRLSTHYNFFFLKSLLLVLQLIDKETERKEMLGDFLRIHSKLRGPRAKARNITNPVF